MEATEVILGSLEKSQDYLMRALDGLTQEEAAWRPGAECNSIAFILWHIARLEDYFVNGVFQHEKEIYEAENWRDKLGTPAKEIGVRYTVEQLQDWPVPKLEDLLGYAKSARNKTLSFLKSVTLEKLSEVVVRPNRPPETVGQRLCLFTTDIAMHVGQIDYLRGVQRGIDK